MDAAHTKSVEEVLSWFNVNADSGLSSKQVRENEAKYGRNELPAEEEQGILSLVVDALKDNLVIILIISAVISCMLSLLSGEKSIASYMEPAVIFLIIIVNATVQIVQDINTDNAIKALSQYSPLEADVIRDGEQKTILAAEIVPGDIVLLSAGGKIPADCRIVKVLSYSLEINESMLTGESESVEKISDEISSDSKPPNSEKKCIVFGGTVVNFGKAVAVVVKTGIHSAIGNMRSSLGAIKDTSTPLKKSLDEFGSQLSKMILFICIFVWLINFKNFSDPSHHRNWFRGAIYYFKIAVSLAVAAIPEGLSIIITTSLALGTNRMAKRGALARKLKSIETLGCTTVICSDKTGTLTTNKMCVRRIGFLETSEELSILTLQGTDFSPFGEVEMPNGKLLSSDYIEKHGPAAGIFFASIVCNDSLIFYDKEQKQYTIKGSPTEAALLVMSEKLFPTKLKPSKDDPDAEYCKVAYKHIRSNFTINDSLDFTRDRKIMSVIVKHKVKSEFNPLNPLDSRASNSNSPKCNSALIVKGAFEYIIDRSTHVILDESDEPHELTSSIKALILSNIRDWAEGSAFRVMGFAFKPDPVLPKKITRDQYGEIEKGLILMGVVAMEDPLRLEVKESIRCAYGAGVKTLVITGDNKKTAESVCKKLGLISPDEDIEKVSFTGVDIDSCSPDKLVELASSAKLFSRTEPHHKMSLVKALRSANNIVAMTGDGVNDAPALKMADIGVAMGSGTDVAKFASDMIIVNDDFMTIVYAIQEGRVIFSNTRQFIRYLISSNIGEVFSILFTVFLGIPESLKPVQLLWINLVTDGLPATALGFNPPDDDVINSLPRDSKEPMITKLLFVRYVIVGFYVGISTLFGFIWSFTLYSRGPKITFKQLSNFHKCESPALNLDCSTFEGINLKRASTVALSVLVFVEMFNALNSVSERQSIFKLSPMKNPRLILSIICSILLHLMVIYIDILAKIFSVFPSDIEEWIAVLVLSLPVILVDEVFKIYLRNSPVKMKIKSD